MVGDGKEEKQCDEIVVNSLLFSPDSKRVAYAARIGDMWFVVVDGREEKHYDCIVTLGGGRIISDSSDSLHYLAQEGSDVYLVKD